jgi:membrane glycosyltransferase
MTETIPPASQRGDSAVHGSAGSTTPTGTQSTAELSRRRWLVLALNAGTYLTLMAWLGQILGTSGWSLVDLALFVCFAIGLPWTVLGFWNAVIGFACLHLARDGLTSVAAFVAAGERDVALTQRTAVLMTLRNEDPARAFARLRVVKASLDATGQGGAFDYFVLSDTNDPQVAAAEEAASEHWRQAEGLGERLVYRRRADNEGYKAGNVRDFCTRWGASYEFMLPLDADSVMSGEAILRMTRIGEAHPKLGILQSLVVGMPSNAFFARVFQFGMRHGMRPYTMGQAWWTGECGPFWGHNALVRIKPFVEQCHLPVLKGGPPLGGHVLSHDQVEATLMRRAGYEVRVLPVEGGSWEENPPTLLEFSRRDVRWCQGNLQYLKLLDLPGLKAISRFQLVWAILMFIGVPAFTLMIALAPLKVLDGEPAAAFPAASAIGLYLTFLTMYLSPKIAGFLDVIVTRGGMKAYGGPLRFVAGVLTEVAFSFLLGAVTTFRITVFMLGLPFGRSVTWNGQARDAHGISWRTAAAGLWAPTLFGVVVCGLLYLLAPAALWWSLPLTLGYLTAIPFTVITASPALGRLVTRWRLCAIPEEFDTPREVAALRPAGA